MLKFIKILKIGVKYAGVLYALVEIVQFAIDKLTPYSEKIDNELSKEN